MDDTLTIGGALVPDEHILLVGKGGSGKTMAIKQLLALPPATVEAAFAKDSGITVIAAVQSVGQAAALGYEIDKMEPRVLIEIPGS